MSAHSSLPQPTAPLREIAPKKPTPARVPTQAPQRVPAQMPKRVPRMWDEERKSPWLILFYIAAIAIGVAWERLAS